MLSAFQIEIPTGEIKDTIKALFFSQENQMASEFVPKLRPEFLGRKEDRDEPW